jgi:hypothetical protein
MTVDTVRHGVDFSGADSGGRAKIVIATRRGDSPVSIRRGVDRSGLRKAILETAEAEERHMWRIDAPFSVPLAVYDRHEIEHDWHALARWMRGFESARDWRRALRTVNRKEPRRTCDREARTPMAPMNLRVFKQTWTVVCEVLLPLAEAGVHIAPVHVTDSPAIVCEACPASVLTFRAISPRGYKGRTEENHARRVELCRLLMSWGIPVSTRDADAAVRDAEGDVLDALLLLAEPSAHVPPVEAGIEAWVW